MILMYIGPWICLFTHSFGPIRSGFPVTMQLCYSSDYFSNHYWFGFLRDDLIIVINTDACYYSFVSVCVYQYVVCRVCGCKKDVCESLYIWLCG